MVQRYELFIYFRIFAEKKFISTIMFGLGMQEIVLIALIVLLLFGGKKIPELMKGLGKGVKSFKDGMKEGIDEEKVESEK